MGKGKAAGFHSCADGFAVCRAAPCVIRHEHGAADRGGGAGDGLLRFEHKFVVCIVD
jgi:hypothetical protein